MKKTFLVSVSAFLMAVSAFAYSKKAEGEANLGRMYVEFGGGASFTDLEEGVNDSNQVGAVANVEFNVPVFKPGVNTMQDINWFGMDLFVNLGYGYTDLDGFYDETNYIEDGNLSGNSFNVAVGLKPYLSVKTGWAFIQAIKPFAYGSVGYGWNSFDITVDDEKTSLSENNFIYNYGGGVELVLTKSFSLSGKFLWHSGDDQDTFRTIDAELTYWANSIVAFSVFGEWNFGNDVIKHSKTFGLKVRFGFGR
ncbi:outer membrane beta-barrel protein [Intestinicryptomonas porci]|uniref:Porin family protein n=1 Tax=Intestinicryptomonas porci TaxID=2926320 RepID=A0ABU4WDX7_9BACT|nr:porin family protein [Opitutales bacterium CLA-KB-P66]